MTKGNPGGREETVEPYCEAMRQLVRIPFEQEAALCFAKLRVANPPLRPPDAIQLACVLSGRCDLFLTNDSRLTGVNIPSKLTIQSLGERAASPRS